MKGDSQQCLWWMRTVAESSAMYFLQAPDCSLATGVVTNIYSRDNIMVLFIVRRVVIAGLISVCWAGVGEGHYLGTFG